jgi:hypothetical protein
MGSLGRCFEPSSDDALSNSFQVARASPCLNTTQKLGSAYTQRIPCARHATHHLQYVSSGHYILGS